MNSTATPIQAQFSQALAARGWNLDRVRVDVASKDYETAAGGRTAFVYCRQNRDGDHVLTGDYWSEGRNVLSTCWALFRPGADEATIASEIERFAAEAEKTIAGTYAMRIKALLADEGGSAPEEETTSAPRY
ncbi:hypothetical protein [Variovorax sp. JS1663]|uniref:hypothetical protein n=1 Tax=Variovorax sp. JS1663 TaxID=1851577 RepID=UPI000B342B4D|nr:hypothetical protein [Variovorax sp. JS1663]OUL97941.1 hypothetical protein A8M77_34220 [Variovorax sp. JS1663]